MFEDFTRKEKIELGLIVGFIFACVITGWVVHSYFEAKAFNDHRMREWNRRSVIEMGGAHPEFAPEPISTWEAMWVQLRIEE
jgi:hypothetical protein